MNLNRDPKSWACIKPDAFLGGSIVQARNVIEMAVQDIAKLAAEIERLSQRVLVLEQVIYEEVSPFHCCDEPNRMIVEDISERYAPKAAAGAVR